MDDNEFEFPPDQLDDVMTSNLPTFPAPVPTPPNVPFTSTQTIPLSMLAHMSVDQLPPTQPNNPQNFSIGQMMRGALSTAHMRTTSCQHGSGGQAAASVTPLPTASSYAGTSTSHTHSLYLSTGQPPQPSDSLDGEYHIGDENIAGIPEDILTHVNNNSSIGYNSSQRSDGVPTTTPTPTYPGRQARIDWSEAEVRSFYQALSQFGTDFSAIAVLFPRRSRSDIKRLYQREMRQKPKEVQQALNQKNPIDMKVFQERYEAKKKEAHVAVKTKELNAEELALVNEIEKGMLGSSPSTTSAQPLLNSNREAETMLPPAALEAGDESTAAPTMSASRKRKRDTAADGANGNTGRARKAKEDPSYFSEEKGGENEALFDNAMQDDREANTPLGSLFYEPTATTPLDDPDDFAFD